jgi:hypothetical protein
MSEMFPFLLIFLLILLQGQSKSTLNLQILYDLYTSTHGEYWIWHDDLGQVWNFSDPNADPCTWQGISCLAETPSINGIRLYEYNLTGELPDSFGALTNLTVINLGANYLNGTIPASMWTLPNLTNLEISYNWLSGSLSPSIQNLKNLTLLDISHNYFTSTLPAEIGNLDNLRTLDVQYNNLSGPIPTNIGSLRRLEELFFSYNNFSSSVPPSISMLTSLDRADFSHNKLTGTISASLISELPNLNYFLVADNLLFGKLTEDMFPGSLEYADLQTNLFSGSLPSTFGKASENMIGARFGENSFHGRIPAGFLTNATSLVGLTLASNFLTHDIISLPWHECVNLESLHLGNNYFTGQFPVIATISYLEIRNNFFRGQVSDSMEILDHHAEQVEVLDMSSNYFSGPLSLATLSPTYVNFSYNFFTGELSNLFGEEMYCVLDGTNCPKLIDMSQNEFSGTLPLNWNEFPLLTLIDVSDNRLTGTLPSYNNSELRLFAASMNCFEGSIPTSLCDSDLGVLLLNGLSSSSWCQLPIFPHTRIHTYYNQYQIEKGIPECLFTRLPQLQTLHLSGNLLTGKIPEVISSLSSPSTLLNDLDLSYNILTGTIPVFFQNKPNWVAVDLASNHLTGLLIEDTFPNNNGASFFVKIISESLIRNTSFQFIILRQCECFGRKYVCL